MVFMAICNRWKDLCNGSKWMKENCERTCEVCKPSKYIQSLSLAIYSTHINQLNYQNQSSLAVSSCFFQYTVLGMYIVHGQLVQNLAKVVPKWDSVKLKFQLNLEEMLAKEEQQNREFAMNKDVQVSFQKIDFFAHLKIHFKYHETLKSNIYL